MTGGGRSQDEVATLNFAAGRACLSVALLLSSIRYRNAAVGDPELIISHHPQKEKPFLQIQRFPERGWMFYSSA